MKNKKNKSQQNNYVSVFGFAIVGVLVLALFAAVVQEHGITGAITRDEQLTYSGSGATTSPTRFPSPTVSGRLPTATPPRGAPSSSSGTQQQYTELKQEIASLKRQVGSLQRLLDCRKVLNGPNGELLGYYLGNCEDRGAQTGGDYNAQAPVNRQQASKPSSGQDGLPFCNGIGPIREHTHEVAHPHCID